MDKIRSGICSFLRIQPASPNTIYISERLDRVSNAIKNRIWYRGSSEELSEMYRQLDCDRSRFWSAVPTVGMEIRKLHTGLPAIIVGRLTDIVMTDMNDILIPPNLADAWKDISSENAFPALLGEAVAETLIIGDGAFKISFDTSLSAFPIVEFVPGDQVEFERERGRMKAVVFHSHYTHEGRDYDLRETYGRGFIESHLFSGSREVPLNSLPQTAKLAQREKEKATLYTRNSIVATLQSTLPKLIDSIFKAYDTGEAEQEQVILSAIRKGYTAFRPKNTQNAEFFRMNKRKMNALVTETQKSMTKATAAALRMANDQYRSIIFGAQVFYNSGAGTLWQAVDMASKRFLQAGINCIEYCNGRRVNIGSYAEMALRTANTPPDHMAEGRTGASL